MSQELWQLDATALARLIRVGQASAREATQSVLGRLDAVNPKLNAVVHPLHAEALAAPEGSTTMPEIVAATRAAARHLQRAGYLVEEGEAASAPVTPA